jgi:hypothetical protein
MSLSPSFVNHILKSQVIKTPFLKPSKVYFPTSPIYEMNNIESPIFIMSPLDSYPKIDPVKFAQIIDFASLYCSSNNDPNNDIESSQTKQSFQPTQLSQLSQLSLSISISPPSIEIKPLPQLSTMKNSLYERRMKAKGEQEK